MQFVVLSSSRGTTFQAILDALREGTLMAQCLGLVADRPDRGCIAKAEAAGLPVVVVEKKMGDPPSLACGERGRARGREEYDRRLHEAIRGLRTKDGGQESTVLPPLSFVLACIGWMSIFSPWFIQQWRNRILNVHPALLPKHGGEGMFGMRVHEAVLASGEKESGMTIHLMDEGVDTGRILLQRRCPVLPEDTPETLRVRVQELEKEWYPRVLQMLHTGEIQL